MVAVTPEGQGLARARINFLSAVLTLLFAATLTGQSGPTAPADQHTKPHADSKAQSGTGKKSAAEQPALLDLKPVSTTEAVQRAAKEMTKRRSDPKEKSASDYTAPGEPMVEQSDPSAVVEFKSARQADSTSDAVVVTAKG